MALYCYSKFLEQNNHAAFDQLHRPGSAPPYSAIYRCEKCGVKEVSTKGHPLPPQNHHQHQPPAPIVWRLIVATH